VDTQHRARANLAEDLAETLLPEHPRRRLAGPGDLKKIKINLVQPRRGALDPVVKPDAEAVETVRLLQRLVDDHLNPEVAFALRPRRKGARPRVVPAARAGGENQDTHRRSEQVAVRAASPQHNFKKRAHQLLMSAIMAASNPNRRAFSRSSPKALMVLALGSWLKFLQRRAFFPARGGCVAS